MAQLGRSNHKALYGASGATFPDNTTGLISEGDMRTFGEDTADSVFFKNDDSYTAPFPFANAAGTDTYTATLSPAITAYGSGGLKVQIVFANANTGAATLNLNSLGAKPITKNGSTALSAGDISAGQALFLFYDGTQFQAQGGGGVVPDASETAKGIIEIATQAEVTTGTDDLRAITTLKLVTWFAKYVIDQASVSTASSPITLNMNSQVQRSFVGSATFATPRTMALSNTTNSMFFNFFFQITNLAAVLTFPSDWISADDSFDGTDWTPPLTGKYTMHGEFDDTNNEWSVSIYGPKV